MIGEYESARAMSDDIEGIVDLQEQNQAARGADVFC